MGIHNHFWPTSKKNVFKTGSRTTAASAVILTLGQKSAVPAQCGVEFQKKNLFSRCPGTCLVNDYKTNFFPHAHSGLHSDGKQKTANSCQIRSEATMPPHLSTAVAWREKKFKHFVFYKYFSLVLGLLKSRILEKVN